MNPAHELVDNGPLGHLRVKAGYSQVALAEKAGITPETLGLLELGKRGAQLRTLRAIARALDVPLVRVVAAIEKMAEQAA